MARRRNRKEYRPELAEDPLSSLALVHRKNQPAPLPSWFRRRDVTSAVAARALPAKRAMPGRLVSTSALRSFGKRLRRGPVDRGLERRSSFSVCRQCEPRSDPLPDRIRMKIVRQVKAAGGSWKKDVPCCR